MLVVWRIVKVIIPIYNFAERFLLLGLGALIFRILFCYRDWCQVCVVLCIYGGNLLSFVFVYS